MIKLVIFLGIRLAGVQNKTGADSLLSPSHLPPLNRHGLKLVCIVNTHSPQTIDYKDHRPQTLDSRIQTTDSRLHTTDYRLQTTNYRLQTTDYRLQTTDYRLQTTDYRLQTTDCILQTKDNRLQTTDYRRQTKDFRLQTTDYRILGVQNNTGANSLLSPSGLLPLNRSGLKLVCIVNILPPCAPATDSILQTTDHRLV